jgi:N-acetylglucosaminyldiphosphoundecaprenol N-acetyl-beta-D-mannosaminyltransferase
MTLKIQNGSLYGLRVTRFSAPELISELSRVIRGKRQATCYGYSLTILPRFRTLPQIYRIAETFEVMVADGKGFYHLCKLFGVPLDSDWALYELTDSLLDQAQSEGFSVMLLGATEESNQDATRHLREKYPGAKILDGINGYFSEQDESAIVGRINAQDPDVLMIGISSPKKEEFVWRNRQKLKARIIVLMGGVIDIYAGKTTPIPKIVKKLCLTWLYRFVQEPLRTRHIVLNGLDVLFRLIPAMAWAKWVRRNPDFSIPAFYGATMDHVSEKRVY